MSFLAAVQSAIFYYVACTPCSQMRHRYKSRQKAKQERAEKMRIEVEQPGLYRHPSPFNTNPYWAEEIAIGPHLPKKSGSRNVSQRGLTATSTGAGADGGSVAAPSLTTTDTNPESRASTNQATVEEEARRLSGADWNKTRYQREDEELWGHELSRMGHKLMDGITKAKSSAGRASRLLEEKLGIDKQVTDEDRYNFYLTPKNPPVNDHHPPIVTSKPAHPHARRWMLQPPPPAKLMEGRIPVSRATSSHSVGSSRRGAHSSDGPPLGRLMSEKRVQEKLRSGEGPTEAELIDALIGRRSTVSSSRTPLSARSRSLSLDSECYSSDGELERERRRRTRVRRVMPAAPDESSEEDEAIALPRSSDSLGQATLPAGRIAQRPKLETILSSGSAATATSPATPKLRRALSNRPNGSRPNITPKGSSNAVPFALKDENRPPA